MLQSMGSKELDTTEKLNNNRPLIPSSYSVDGAIHIQRKS